MRRRLETYVEAWRRDSKQKWRLRIRSTKWGFLKKNVGGVRYKPRRDWFSFAKVRKLFFLCSCKQTHETSISHRRVRCTYVLLYVICQNGLHVWQRKWEKSVYTILKYWYFSYKNAPICYRRPLFTPWSHVRHVLLMDGCALFDFFWTVAQKHPPSAI